MDTPQTPDKSENLHPAAAVCPPAEEKPPPEEWGGFPTQFARLFFGAVTLLVLYYAYEIVKPFLIDIFLALVLFFTARPLHQALTRMLYGFRTLASLLTCIILALIILVPLFTLVSIISRQAWEFSSRVTQALTTDELWRWVNMKFQALMDYLASLNFPLPPEQVKLENVVRTVLLKGSEFVATNAYSLLSGFTTFFLDFILVLFIAFFMFLQGDDFIEELKKLSPLDAQHNDMIFGEMEATIKATLWGTVVVAFIQGVLGGVGFFLFGVPQAAFWGTVMVPASVIPVVGAAIIWLPGVLYLFFQGSPTMAVGLLIYCALFISSIDNLVKPYLMRGARNTPAIFVLFSILGGISYFGMIGFILGPLILSFLLSLLSIYQKTILAVRKEPSGPAPAETPRALPPQGEGPDTAPPSAA
uniref:AI-2E family transporter n=1 Tax=Desulfobacca acetoxidans TaxID=60893 RepID=A0A7V4G816_9BACT